MDAPGGLVLNLGPPTAHRLPPTSQPSLICKCTLSWPVHFALVAIVGGRQMLRTTKTDRVVLSPADSHPTLFVLYTPSIGITEQAEALRDGSTYIGRDILRTEGLLFAEDEKLSRKHARIECTPVPQEEMESDPTLSPYRVRIVDEQSKNGCFLNGQQVLTETLLDGDVIRVGDTVLLLRWQPTNPEDGPVHELLGRSAAIADLRRRLQMVAASKESAVLLLGEPGVGKELAAKSLHQQSGRCGPFVPFNCASLSDTLADKELFGHERGAFTGADRRSDGLFRAATKGTLFLDEVGELPLTVQAKLLRALQERTIMPVGGTQQVAVDVRVVSATNRDLEKEVREGRFRDDLYSRLRGEVVNLPSLRDRREDVLLLLQQFVGTEAKLTPRLAIALVHYSWPHNVRELKQMAEVLKNGLNHGPWLDLPLVEKRFRNLPEQSQTGTRSPEQMPQREPMERAKEPPNRVEMPSERLHLDAEQLRALLEDNSWNVSAVARVLHRSRRQVRRWMDKFGLQ